jgi:hypothetical protein
VDRSLSRAKAKKVVPFTSANSKVKEAVTLAKVAPAVDTTELVTIKPTEEVVTNEKGPSASEP